MEEDTTASLRQSIDCNEKRFADILHERDKLYLERDARYQERFHDVREASNLVAKETDHRFGVANEWRGTMTDVINTRVSRDEFNQRHEQTIQKLDDVIGRVLTIEGRSNGIGASISIIISTVAILLSVFSTILDLIHHF